MLLARVAETIHRHNMFERGQPVGVAVSGGADSVCLLHVLLELALGWDLKLGVLHVNHGLRGAESCGDENFVRDLAEGLGLPAIVRSIDLAAAHDNLEQAARRARLAFFREQIASGLVVRVATGHTVNDQAETVLFRFLRGSGGAGLAAIRPVTTEGLVRPLLGVTRAEILEYLREREIKWREDSTNASMQFARNRIRHQLLPQLAAEWNPAIAETLHRTADWALAEEEYWEAEIGRVYGQSITERSGALLIPVRELQRHPTAVARRLARHALAKAKGDLRGIDFAHIDAVVRLATGPVGHGRVQAAGLEVERSLDWLRFVKSGTPQPCRGYQMAVPIPGQVYVPGTTKVISLELIEKPETLGPRESVYNRGTGCIDWHVLSGPLEVRNWRPGDQYQPKGSASEEKIKILFQKARIPRWERRYWPVVTDGSAIVWAGQFGVAEPFAADSESTLLLRIREGEAAAEIGIGSCQSGV